MKCHKCCVVEMARNVTAWELEMREISGEAAAVSRRAELPSD
ncbi:MAG: hypothetical protein ACLU62_02605 [Hydrogeniiclostridium sp.]